MKAFERLQLDFEPESLRFASFELFMAKSFQIDSKTFLFSVPFSRLPPWLQGCAVVRQLSKARKPSGKPALPSQHESTEASSVNSTDSRLCPEKSFAPQAVTFIVFLTHNAFSLMADVRKRNSAMYRKEFALILTPIYR